MAGHAPDATSRGQQLDATVGARPRAEPLVKGYLSTAVTGEEAGPRKRTVPIKKIALSILVVVLFISDHLMSGDAQWVRYALGAAFLVVRFVPERTAKPTGPADTGHPAR